MIKERCKNNTSKINKKNKSKKQSGINTKKNKQTNI